MDTTNSDLSVTTTITEPATGAHIRNGHLAQIISSQISLPLIQELLAESEQKVIIGKDVSADVTVTLTITIAPTGLLSPVIDSGTASVTTPAADTSDDSETTDESETNPSEIDTESVEVPAAETTPADNSSTSSALEAPVTPTPETISVILGSPAAGPIVTSTASAAPAADQAPANPEATPADSPVPGAES